MNQIAKKLFEIEAIKVADPRKPFWYTSGKLGPYFINTHFLYGNETAASRLLQRIDQLVATPEELIERLPVEVEEFYQTNVIYRGVMDEFVKLLNQNKNFRDADFISGGERRDWFFSIMAAKLTGKPHLYIFKNLTIYDEKQQSSSLKGKKIAHIADLITEASSYERAWIPAIENLGGKITFTASIVDRDQGGRELLSQKEIELFSPVVIGKEFFDSAYREKILNKEQLEMIIQFTEDPDGYGADFLMKNPNYIADSIQQGDKSTQSKAKRCLEENPYHLKNR